MQNKIKTTAPGSYNSEVAIEIVIDGVTVKAVAYRTIRSHCVEILESFEATGSGTGNIPIFAIQSYQKHLQTIDLYQDSLNLVQSVYQQHKALYDPEAPEHELYKAFRPRLFAAREEQEKKTWKLRTKISQSKKRFKAGEIDEKVYTKILRELRKQQYLAKEFVEDIERTFIKENFKSCCCCDQLLKTLEKVYQHQNCLPV